MRIVFDNIVYTLQRGGGISVVWKEITSRFLQNRLDKLTFVEYEKNRENMFHEEMAIPAEDVEMRCPFIFVLDRYSDVRLKYNNPFIFHSSYFRLCNNNNAINVTTVHDFTYDIFYKGKRRGAFLHMWQRNRAIRKSDAVVCISESTKRDLIKYLPDVPVEKLHVIYNAASDEYKVVEDRIPGLTECLLFVGGRNAYKNGKWFAECIKDQNYKVIFCGSAMSDEEKAYYDSVLGPERYEVKVGLSNKELNRYYNSVRCLVYPSSYEGFGIPVLEAQRAGCPVIALNTSSIPEIIGETPLLMRELTKEELLSKLEILKDNNERAEIIKNGIENAKRFSWDLAYKQYRELYEALLNELKQ